MLGFGKKPSKEPQASQPGASSSVEQKMSRAEMAVMINGLRVEYPAKDYLILLRDGYKRNAVGRFCVDRIARSVGSVPIKVRRKRPDGTTEAVTNSPLQRLLDNPSIYLTERELKEQAIRHLLIGGTGFLARLDPDQPLSRKVQRVTKAKPAELYLLPPQHMRQVFKGGSLAEYEYTSPEGIVRFYNDAAASNAAEMSMIAELRITDPMDDLKGSSPLAASAADIDILNESKLHNLSTIKNGMRTSGILSFAKRLGDDARRMIRGQLENEYQGPNNSGKPLVVEGEDVKWTETGISPKDADFIQMTQESAKAMCLSLGVPPIFLGIKGDSTYSNYREANKAFWLDTVSYYVGMLCEQLTDFLCPLYGRDLVIEPDYSGVPAMQDAKVDQATSIKDLDFMSKNEKRAVLGLPAVEGWDARAGTQTPDVGEPRKPEAPSEDLPEEDPMPDLDEDEVKTLRPGYMESKKFTKPRFVQSSNVKYLSYDRNQMILEVGFLNDSVYHYYGVEADVWHDFIAADSYGKFVWTDLRDKYPYARIK